MSKENDRIKQENALLKAKLILKDGTFGNFDEIEPAVENQFLKQCLAFDEAPVKPFHEILDVNPRDFPPSDGLSEHELRTKLDMLLTALDNHGISLDLNEGIPPRLVYTFLAEDYLHELVTDFPGLHIDGCSGWCPDCFQADYCKTIDEIWTKEELERERRKKDGIED